MDGGIKNKMKSICTDSQADLKALNDEIFSSRLVAVTSHFSEWKQAQPPLDNADWKVNLRADKLAKQETRQIRASTVLPYQMRITFVKVLQTPRSSKPVLKR